MGRMLNAKRKTSSVKFKKIEEPLLQSADNPCKEVDPYKINPYSSIKPHKINPLTSDEVAADSQKSTFESEFYDLAENHEKEFSQGAPPEPPEIVEIVEEDQVRVKVPEWALRMLDNSDPSWLKKIKTKVLQETSGEMRTDNMLNEDLVVALNEIMNRGGWGKRSDLMGAVLGLYPVSFYNLSEKDALRVIEYGNRILRENGIPTVLIEQTDDSMSIKKDTVGRCIDLWEDNEPLRLSPTLRLSPKSRKTSKDTRLRIEEESQYNPAFGIPRDRDYYGLDLSKAEVAGREYRIEQGRIEEIKQEQDMVQEGQICSKAREKSFFQLSK